MPVRIGTGLSVAVDALTGAQEAAAMARDRLDGAACDVCVVFASGTHLVAPEATLEGIGDVLAPSQLVGCGAQGVLGDGREIERGTAVAVWAASLGAGTATAFHAAVEETAGTYVTGMPDLSG